MLKLSCVVGLVDGLWLPDSWAVSELCTWAVAARWLGADAGLCLSCVVGLDGL